MLNLAIGLFVVYLILSMLCSGIQEAIAGWIRLRGKMLLGAIEKMLTNQEGGNKENNELYSEFVNNKWFKSLCRSKLTWLQRILPIKKDPSYIEDEAFGTIILQVLGSSASLPAIQQKVNNMADGDLKNFLQDLIHKSNGNITVFKKSITDWYNSIMSEVSSWYRSRSHTMLFLIGMILATVLNADTFSIYYKLSKDPALQQELVALAENYVNQGGFEASSPAVVADSTQAQLQTLEEQITELVSEGVGSIYTPLGLGWEDFHWSKLLNPAWLFMKLLGILITSFAIAMGASFWFSIIKNLLSFGKGGSTTTAPTSQQPIIQPIIQTQASPNPIIPATNAPMPIDLGSNTLAPFTTQFPGQIVGGGLPSNTPAPDTPPPA